MQLCGSLWRRTSICLHDLSLQGSPRERTRPTSRCRPRALTRQYRSPLQPSTRVALVELFFKCDIATYNALQMPVLRAEKQSAVGVQRFGAAANDPLADANDDVLAEGGAA